MDHEILKHNAGNFFATRNDAINNAKGITASGRCFSLSGPGKVADTELKIGQVVIDTDKPDAIAKPNIVEESHE